MPQKRNSDSAIPLLDVSKRTESSSKREHSCSYIIQRVKRWKKKYGKCYMCSHYYLNKKTKTLRQDFYASLRNLHLKAKENF
jgi:uncharacterized Fe-S cluster-containing MiaB family protein